MNAAEPNRKDAEGPAAVPVQRRRVVYLAGFDPTPPETLARHTASGLRKFASLWDAEATSSEPTLSPDAVAMDWHVTARGRNWTTETDYTILRWDHLMAPYVQRSWVGRVLSGYIALVRLAAQGMIVRYFRANFRYGLFVLYPFMLLAGAIILAWLAATIVAAFGVPSPEVVVPLTGLGAFLLLFRGLGAYFHIQFALADWSFALDLMMRRVPGLDACVKRFAETLKDAARTSGADEVMIAATSMGAVLLAEALEKALGDDPDLCRRAPRFAMLTVGSSILKIGLHPSATDLRAAVARVGGEKSLFWVEYQAKVDFINFYKNDPVAELTGSATGRPIIRNVRVRDMMGDQVYKRRRYNLLALHRQFVLPNGQRYFFDFYQACFGPLALFDRLEMGENAAGVFARDGSFRPELSGALRNFAVPANEP